MFAVVFAQAEIASGTVVLCCQGDTGVSSAEDSCISSHGLTSREFSSLLGNFT